MNARSWAGSKPGFSAIARRAWRSSSPRASVRRVDALGADEEPRLAPRVLDHSSGAVAHERAAGAVGARPALLRPRLHGRQREPGRELAPHVEVRAGGQRRLLLGGGRGRAQELRGRGGRGVASRLQQQQRGQARRDGHEHEPPAPAARPAGRPSLLTTPRLARGQRLLLGGVRAQRGRQTVLEGAHDAGLQLVVAVRKGRSLRRARLRRMRAAAAGMPSARAASAIARPSSATSSRSSRSATVS